MTTMIPCCSAIALTCSRRRNLRRSSCYTGWRRSCRSTSITLRMWMPQTTWWVRYLNLTVHDRDVIERRDWLNDKVVDAVNCLVAKHLNIPDMQSSLLAQSEFCSVGRAVQIVYNSSHWVAATGADDDVQVANSVGDSVSANSDQRTKRTVSYSYWCRWTVASRPSQMHAAVKLVWLWRVAAAFVFEWAANSLHANLDRQFEVRGMCQHLISCVERQEVTPFPKTRAQRKQQQRANVRPRITRYHCVTVWQCSDSIFLLFE